MLGPDRTDRPITAHDFFSGLVQKRGGRPASARTRGRSRGRGGPAAVTVGDGALDSPGNQREPASSHGGAEDQVEPLAPWVGEEPTLAVE